MNEKFPEYLSTLLVTSRLEGVQGYVITLLLIAVALSLRLALWPIEAGLQYITFFPTVTLAVLTAGFWPGIFAMIMGVLLGTFIFTYPYYSFSFEAVEKSFWSNLVFMMDCLLVCVSIEAKHRYRLKYVQKLDQAKVAHAESQRSSQHFQQIFDNVLDGIITIDEKGIIESFNHAAEQIFGYDAAEVTGKNVSMLMPEPYHGQHDGYLHNYIRTGDKKIIGIGREVAGKRKDGSTFPMDLAVCEIKGDVRMFTGIVRDISKRKAIEAHMQHLAHHDQLTGLPNRTLFADRLQQALAKAKRDSEKVALMFIDLDKFKPINDTLGHDIGDLLLKAVTRRLQDSLRESDTVARLGGDEFVALLPITVADHDAMRVAEKICHSLNQPFELAGHSIHISSSIGIAVFPDHGSEENLLVKNADTAMYHAKNSGRNNVKLYQPDMQAITQ